MWSVWAKRDGKLKKPRERKGKRYENVVKEMKYTEYFLGKKIVFD